MSLINLYIYVRALYIQCTVYRQAQTSPLYIFFLGIYTKYLILQINCVTKKEANEKYTYTQNTISNMRTFYRYRSLIPKLWCKALSTDGHGPW